MDKNEIAAFFDGCAPFWDGDMIRNEDVIAKILDNANVTAGAAVLDVACGTGVLFPDYLKRGVASLTAVDLSPEMVKIARKKFPQAEVILGDVEELKFDRKFDVIMVYNALPHFPEPERLIKTLCPLLKSGGTLSIAHGMSRERILRHHSGSARPISIDLLHETELARIMENYCTVESVVSNGEMYQVTGRNQRPK
ncbi:MAG: class I SAM-dependent methyltransferase [Oscillospiraceae bacterium]|nr:class I SAM-dependent methyltransferase [Oscillospiraceae bacterium]